MATTAMATGRDHGNPPPPPTAHNTNKQGQAQGQFQGQAQGQSVKNTVKNRISTSNSNSNRNNNINHTVSGGGTGVGIGGNGIGHGGAGGRGGDGGRGGTALASGGSGGTGGNSNVNVSNINNNEVAASSAFAAAGNSTAPCQGYAAAGVQAVNFGLSFSFSRTVKPCMNLLYAEQAGRFNSRQWAILVALDPRMAAIGAPVAKRAVVRRSAKKRGCGC